MVKITGLKVKNHRFSKKLVKITGKRSNHRIEQIYIGFVTLCRYNQLEDYFISCREWSIIEKFFKGTDSRDFERKRTKDGNCTEQNNFF